MSNSRHKPLCFVLMPFGKKRDVNGRPINFDRTYEDVFAPAIQAARMEPLRADEERDGGIIHKPMFERLVLCQFAVADLTLANANVFYELGVRHAVRPYSTVLVFARSGQRLPFDVAPLRAIPYEVDPSGTVVAPESLVDTIRDHLVAARDPATDSPLYQLIDGMTPPDVARLKTDVFRDRVRYSNEIKRRLATARSGARDAVATVHADLEPLGNREAGILIDLLLAYRDVDAHEDMVTVAESMPSPIARSVLVREQRAFALNRLGRRNEAQELLEDLIAERGPSSETYGLLGRVHKDRWSEALAHGRDTEANAHLRRAIEAYTAGFEADWRDAFPGVNALTLLEIQSPDQEEFNRLLPVVRYAIERRLESGAADYWDHASMLEVAVLGGHRELAEREAGECMAMRPHDWQRQTTARNLRMLLGAKQRRGEDTSLVQEAISWLE